MRLVAPECFPWLVGTDRHAVTANSMAPNPSDGRGTKPLLWGEGRVFYIDKTILHGIEPERQLSRAFLVFWLPELRSLSIAAPESPANRVACSCAVCCRTIRACTRHWCLWMCLSLVPLSALRL